MAYFLQLKQVNHFRLKSYDSKHWQKWDEATSKFLQSDSFVAGYSPKYVFRIEIENKEEKLISFSREQLGQILIGAFEAKKPLLGLAYNVKTNNKKGKDIRYYINLDGGSRPNGFEAKPQTNNYPETPVPPVIPTENTEEIPF